MARLREEILSKVGPTKRPSYDDLRDMKYLRAVINGMSLCLISLDVNPIPYTRNYEIVPRRVSQSLILRR